MTFFGGEVKPSAPFCKILRRVKYPYTYERDTSKAKFKAIYLQVSPASPLNVTVFNCKRSLVDESGMIKTQHMDAHQFRNDHSAWDALCDTTP
jgi:hypothetical protein